MLLPLLLLFLLLPCAQVQLSCDFQSPTFISQDLKNILTWTTAEKSEGVKYSVTYLIYGTPTWHKIPECTNITRTWCDLTKETSNHEEYYFGNVTVNSSSCSKRTERFSPHHRTEISPPTINLFPNDTFMEIKLTHPMSRTINNLKYRIYLNGKIIAETKSLYYKQEHLVPNTKYCVAAEVEWGLQKSIQSNQTCVTVNIVYISQSTFLIFSVVPVILVILLVIALGYTIYKYIHVKNIGQPHTLNMKANNKDVILVEAHTVTINLITIDGSLNLQHTMITDKEEGEEEPRDPSDLYFTEGDKHISLDSGITEAEEGSDDDNGYKSLQEEITPASPTISPYDMPHYLRKEDKALDTSSDIENKENLYGRIKCHSIHNDSIEEKVFLYALQNECTNKTSFDTNAYLPHGDSNFAVQDKVQKEILVFEEFCTDQNSDIGVNVMTGTDLSEHSMLFIDWSPNNPHLYIPKLSKKKELEKCIQQCKEESESFLSQLEVQEMAEVDELGQLEERWGLLLQGTEK